VYGNNLKMGGSTYIYFIMDGAPDRFDRDSGFKNIVIRGAAKYYYYQT